MSIKRLFSVRERSTFVDLATLLIRVVAGVAFTLHGWGKIQSPFSWMGPDAFAPGIFQALATVSEFGGGIAWVLGLVTPLASLGIACTMTVAVCFHTFLRGNPFVATGLGPASEPAAVYFCVAVLLIALGPGRISLDRQIFGPR